MTIKEIAQIAGVSTATVSRVINDSPKVSQKIKKKVNMIIDKNEYVPNLMGRQLRQSVSKKILVLLPFVDSPFFNNVFLGIEEQASRYGYDPLIYSTHETEVAELRALEMLKTRQVDGAVLLLSWIPKQELEKLSKKYPIVLACDGVDDSSLQLSNVSINVKRAIYDATMQCVRAGRKRIAFIRDANYKTSVDVSGEKGYLQAISEAGIPYREELNIHGGSGTKGGEEVCAKLLALEEPSDAVVSISDQLAIGCVRHLLLSGKKPGKDMDVIGFHDSPIISTYIPAISTIAQPMRQMGATAFDLLREKIHDINCMDKTIILPHKLILRQTTC